MYRGNYLVHYGVPGRSGKKNAGLWYKDGELTEAGYEHYYGIRKQSNNGKNGNSTEDGKRRYVNDDGTKNYKKIKKEAAEDAKEYARAKAYYGDGAGTRRKKIKNLISEKMKDPDYKKEFESQLASQDMAKHQKAANRERKVQDTKDKAARIGRGLKNLMLGIGTTSVTAIALYNTAKMVGADKKIAELGKTTLSKARVALSNLKPGNYGGYNWTSSNSSSAFMEFMNKR